jgi:hypothetical protein
MELVPPNITDPVQPIVGDSWLSNQSSSNVYQDYMDRSLSMIALYFSLWRELLFIDGVDTFGTVVIKLYVPSDICLTDKCML